MNSASLATNTLGTSSLNHALRSQPSVPTGVGDVSAVDDPDQLQGTHTHNNHVSHNSHSNHPQQNHHMHLPHHHSPQYGSITQIIPLQDSFGKINDNIAKLENDVASLSQELAYFRHVVDFQNSKVEKLTQLLSDVLQNKDTSSIANSLQSLQEGDPFNVNDNHDSVDDSVPESVHDSVHESVHDSVHDPVHDSVHDVTSGISALQSSNVVQVPGVVDVSGVSLTNNMDPQLHQVAQAAVSAQGKGGKRKRSYAKVNGNSDALKAQQQSHQQQAQQQRQLQQSSIQQEQNQQHQAQQRAQGAMQQRQQQQTQQAQQAQQQQAQQQQQQSQQAQQSQQRQQSQDNGKNNMVSMPGLEVVSVDEMGGRKKPKIAVDFLHNPMTVKDIYDEFTRGFRGQPPLREMDERFGKHEWRGDSRSKESKRYQRRKKLCDAIERGMAKYGKSAEEVIRFIEDFRGEKSLTWVMNGNLPRDLLD